jgi:hypothetical protein
LKDIKKYISKNSDSLTIWFIIIGLVLTAIILFIEKDNRTLLNVLSISGTMASFFGLAIAFIQIIALKDISEVTQLTINNTKDKLKLGISITDVTEGIKLISEIENYLGNLKFEIARLRLTDLKEKLIRFKSSDAFLTIVQKDEIKKIVDDLDIQISNLYSCVYPEPGSEILFDNTILKNQLPKITTYLTEFRDKIQYQTV